MPSPPSSPSAIYFMPVMGHEKQAMQLLRQGMKAVPSIASKVRGFFGGAARATGAGAAANAGRTAAGDWGFASRMGTNAATAAKPSNWFGLRSAANAASRAVRPLENWFDRYPKTVFGGLTGMAMVDQATDTARNALGVWDGASGYQQGLSDGAYGVASKLPFSGLWGQPLFTHLARKSEKAFDWSNPIESFRQRMNSATLGSLANRFAVKDPSGNALIPENSALMREYMQNVGVPSQSGITTPSAR